MRLFQNFLFAISITLQPLLVHGVVKPDFQHEPAAIVIANNCDSRESMFMSGNRSFEADSESGLEFPLQVLSWNIEKTNNEGWKEDLTAYSENFSLVLLQEAASHAELKNVLSDFSGLSMAPGYHTGDVQTGVLTASRSPAIRHCYLEYQEPWLRSDKTAQLSWYPIKNSSESLLVANIHSINFTLGITDYNRQLQALASIAERHEGPMIISGDFNSWSNQRVQSLQQIAIQLGLVPVSFTNDNRTQAFGHPIDHIYTRGLRHQGSHTKHTTSSDHNPLFAELSIAKPERLAKVAL